MWRGDADCICRRARWEICLPDKTRNPCRRIRGLHFGSGQHIGEYDANVLLHLEQSNAAGWAEEGANRKFVLFARCCVDAEGCGVILPAPISTYWFTVDTDNAFYEKKALFIQLQPESKIATSQCWFSRKRDTEKDAKCGFGWNEGDCVTHIGINGADQVVSYRGDAEGRDSWQAGV